jgi:hypothetical protein
MVKIKFFFAEELLYYPYCDCEDRSVLFSYLVRNLVGLEVCGLEYPGHMSTAVNFDSNVSGDYISFEGKRYVILKPSFIGGIKGSLEWIEIAEKRNQQDCFRQRSR